jgi:hypothetical protein
MDLVSGALDIFIGNEGELSFERFICFAESGGTFFSVSRESSFARKRTTLLPHWERVCVLQDGPQLWDFQRKNMGEELRRKDVLKRWSIHEWY